MGLGVTSGVRFGFVINRGHITRVILLVDGHRRSKWVLHPVVWMRVSCYFQNTAGLPLVGSQEANV